MGAWSPRNKWWWLWCWGSRLVIFRSRGETSCLFLSGYRRYRRRKRSFRPFYARTRSVCQVSLRKESSLKLTLPCRSSCWLHCRSLIVGWSFSFVEGCQATNSNLTPFAALGIWIVLARKTPIHSLRRCSHPVWSLALGRNWWSSRLELTCLSLGDRWRA